MWVLLLLPFVGLLWVPFYNFDDPALFGFPFFYWYQLAWVPITSLLIWLVYRCTHARRRNAVKSREALLSKLPWPITSTGSRSRSSFSSSRWSR